MLMCHLASHPPCIAGSGHWVTLQVDGYTRYNRVLDPKSNADIKLA